MRPALRDDARASDKAPLLEILSSTGAFHGNEIDVALELLEDRLEKGQRSEYYFIFADEDGVPVGYICYGPITMSAGRFDLYWIAVSRSRQGGGLGTVLLDEAERRMRLLGAERVYVETSSRKAYEKTRAFYKKRGYAEVARIPGFYADGDDKVVFMKLLGKGRGGASP